MEEVPFCGHFPTDTQLRVIGKLFVAPVSQGQSPPAVLVVHDQHRRFLHVDHLFGDGEFFPDERMGLRVLLFYQVQPAVQLVISGFRGFPVLECDGRHPQCPPVVAQAVEQSAGCPVPGYFCDSLEQGRGGSVALLVPGVIEADRGESGSVGLDPDPFARFPGIEFDEAAFSRGEGDGFQLAPVPCSLPVHLENEYGRGLPPVVNPSSSAGPSSEQERFGNVPGLYPVVQPDGSRGRGCSQPVGFVEGGEPQVGVRLSGSLDSSFVFAFIQEFPVCRIVTSEDQLAVPPGKIADDFQVGRPRSDTG